MDYYILIGIIVFVILFALLKGYVIPKMDKKVKVTDAKRYAIWVRNGLIAFVVLFVLFFVVGLSMGWI
jgi:hypothetical protein